jgi:hypothetical protein
MHHHDIDQRWPLRGFWRAWLWISAGIGGVLAAAGLGLAVLARWAPFPTPVVLLAVGVVLVGVGALITWQVADTVLDATLTGDGTLILRRPGRELRTRATRVRQLRFSALVSKPHTPIVIETADGSARLLHPRREVDELIAALRHHNPQLQVRL